MLKREEFLVEARLEVVVLESWVLAGWLVPQRHEPHFTEADLARARLIGDLKHDLGINDEGVGVVLDLIDQLHGLRRTVRDLTRALQAGPVDLRTRLLEQLRGETDLRGSDLRETSQRGASE